MQYAIAIKQADGSIIEHKVRKKEKEFTIDCFSCGHTFTEMLNIKSVVNCPGCGIICGVGKQIKGKGSK